MTRPNRNSSGYGDHIRQERKEERTHHTACFSAAHAVDDDAEMESALLTADTITDEQIVTATAFNLRCRETNAELIVLRSRAISGQGRGMDVSPDQHQEARARCAEILNDWRALSEATAKHLNARSAK